MGFWINFAGLFLAGIGAFLLVFFSLPALDVTKDGQPLILFTGTRSDVVVEANKRKYNRHSFWSRSGVCLLAIGFALQIVGALIDHFC
jgi:hypothetical protein